MSSWKIWWKYKFRKCKSEINNLLEKKISHILLFYIICFQTSCYFSNFLSNSRFSSIFFRTCFDLSPRFDGCLRFGPVSLFSSLKPAHVLGSLLLSANLCLESHFEIIGLGLIELYDQYHQIEKRVESRKYH